MGAVADDFSAPNNATLERFYQITSGGAPQDITGWSLHSQWRNTDGSLALDLDLANGLLQLVSATIGQFKVLIEPEDLKTLTAGALSFDILAIPPRVTGGTPRVYQPFSGVATITPGCTLARVR